MAQTILVVDDDPKVVMTLRRPLELSDFQVELAAGGRQAVTLVSDKPVDAVLMDVKMPDMDGLQALEEMRRLRPRMPVVIMTGNSTLQIAIRAIQLGANDFITKPIDGAHLVTSIRNVLDHAALKEMVEALQEELGRFDMVGSNAEMQRLYERIQKSAPTQGRVLITGESGTGKELVAQALHLNSPRRNGPFVKVNCAAVPSELIESELFGHEKGAFTGAIAARKGKFEQADKGSLFLDEVGDMPLNMQAKLLRVLQEGEIERLGSAKTIAVDVRVIAATNKDLPRAIATGAFREDLYYRLNVVPMHVPPLRERRGDIALLARSFIREACVRNGCAPKRLSEELIQELGRHDYPGNVRELKNLVERLAILCVGPEIALHEAGGVLPWPALSAGRTLSQRMADAERACIQETLRWSSWDLAQAAKLLGLEVPALQARMSELGLEPKGSAPL